MPNITLALLTGILLQLNLPYLIAPLWLIALIIASSTLAYLVKYKRFYLASTALFFGILLVSIVGNNLLEKLLPKSLENQTILVEGVIAATPLDDDKKTVFDFVVSKINAKEQSPLLIKLSWYKQNQTIPKLDVGDVYQLKVKLKRPNGFKNKVGFDYQTWLFAKGYSAKGYVKKSQDNLLLPVTAELSNPCFCAVEKLRHAFYEKSNKLLQNSEYKGIYQALILGIKTSIDNEQAKLMRGTGTSHILAISGLHIGIIALLFFSLGAGLWHLSRTLQNHFIRHHFSISMAFFGAFIYALMAGFSLPTQRAIIMLLVIGISQLLYRKNSLWNSFWLALFIILLLDPLAPLNAGFWLSFGAIVIIFYVLNIIKDRQYSFIKSMLIIQFAMAIGMVPLLLLNFNMMSLNSFIANLFAIPIASFIIIPLSFIMMFMSLIWPPISMVLLWVLDKLLNLYFYVLQVIEQLVPYKLYSGFDFSIIDVVLVGLVLFFGYQIHRYLAVGLLLITLFLVYPQKEQKDLEIHVFDVGQGLAILVTTKNHYLLYDTGVAYSEKFTAVNSIIIPYLKSNGITHLDKLVLSHSDSDHIGDYRTLVEEVNVKKVETGQPDFFTENFDQCHQQLPWSWDKITFRYLMTQNKKKSDNDLSCVLQIIAKQTLLITGDITKEQEVALVTKYGELLKSDVLIVPHHGSKTSSSVTFLKWVQPSIALSSNGYLSRFGHPHKSVVARYKKQGIGFYSTDKSGALTVNFSKQGFDINSVKKQQYNKWYNFN